MKIVELLAKMTYWNSWFYKGKKMVSIRSLKSKMFNPKYVLFYLCKQDDELKYLLPNVITCEYHEFILRKCMLNKKQHIILLNNVHDVPTIYDMLYEEGFKVSVLNWKKFKNVNEVFNVILKYEKKPPKRFRSDDEFDSLITHETLEQE